MEDLKLEQVEISGVFDRDDECRVDVRNVSAFINKEEVQQVINHLTLLLKV